jgi:geranylgeranyl transferase type-2 subunit alpha
MSHEAIL